MVNISLIPFIPAAGAIITGVIGSRRFSRRVSAAIACGAMAAALVLSAWALIATAAAPIDARIHDVVLGDWIPSIPLQTATGIEMFTVKWTFRIDPLSAVIATLVSGIGLLMHLYAAAEMQHESEQRYARFFSCLSLSCAFMLTLVLAGNFLVLLVGWQGMALCSYLLIGFWFERPAAAHSATKAFIVTWLGDWGLVVAIFLVYFTFGTLDFREVAASVTSLPVEAGTFGAISGICLGLWIAAVAKSAQIPLHVWLPDAVDGPSPALALIQTATTMTAGVFVIARNAALLERAPVVMTMITTFGMLTALMAAALALVQTDIKRVLVYSTISQVGLLFTALGVGAFAAAIFHLVTLGVSQSLLFLGSSTLVRTMDGEKDMHRMGGLRQYMPATFVTMMVGALTVTGIPPLSGFFSANEIAAGILAGHRLLWVISCLTAVLTAIYVTRLMLLTFFGTYRGPARTWPDSSSREAPLPVIVTLMALAVATIVLGFIGMSMPGHASSFVHLLTSAATLNNPQRSLSTLAILAFLVSVLLPFAGIAIARRIYRRDPGMDLDLSTRWPDGHALLANQYYFNELYATTLLSGVFTTARGLARFDARVINALVNGCGWTIQIAGWMAHMVDKYVVDRIADGAVQGFRFLTFRFKFSVFRSRTYVINRPARSNGASERASEPRDRSEPSKRRARARVGESEGRSPSG